MKKYLSSLVLVLLLSFSMVNAQDETPPPPEPTPTLGSIEITVTPGGEPVLLPADETTSDTVLLSWGQLLLLFGLSAVVLLPTGAGLTVIVFKYLERKDVRDTAEHLYQSASPEVQKMIREQLAYAQETISKLVNFIEAISDGKPNNEIIVAQVAAQVMERIQSEDKARWGMDVSKGVNS